MKTFVAIGRTYLVLTAMTALGVGGATLAQHVQHTGKDRVRVTQLSQREIIEKLDGKESSATVLEVTAQTESIIQQRTIGATLRRIGAYTLDGKWAEPNGRRRELVGSDSLFSVTRLALKVQFDARVVFYCRIDRRAIWCQLFKTMPFNQPRIAE